MQIANRSAIAFRARSRKSALATTIRELATLLSVGIPLVDALDVLTNQYRGSLRNSLLALQDRVNSGARLSEAAAEQVDLFDELSVRMIEVGETSGSLDLVLHRLADFLESSLELKDRIISALIYPAIVLFTSIIVSVFLMTIVLPTLLDQLIEAGHPLPWPTLVLKFLSDALLQYGIWIGLVLFMLLASVVVLSKTKKGRRVTANFVLSIPIFGSLAARQHISRIAYIMSALLSTGIEFVKAAEIAARGTRNPIFREALNSASTSIQNGEEIGPALARTGVFPAMVIQIFTVGQASGHLETMLERLATTYDRQVASLSRRIATVIEPVLILALAVIIGFILFATILPILEAGNVV